MSAIPSIYLNLEDDVSRIVARIKRASTAQLVLVCPKRCALFSDSINLRLLKKQTDLLGKEVFILTMDEKGQMYAKEAGFQLKFLPKTTGTKTFSDIQMHKVKPEPQEAPQVVKAAPVAAATVAGGIKRGLQNLSPSKIFSSPKNPAPAPSPAIISTKVVQPEPPVEVNDNIFPQEIEHVQPEKEKKSHLGKIIAGLVTLSIIVVLLLMFIILPKATVVVYPKTEPITRDMEISMSPNISGLDETKLVMPATKVDETISLSNKFSSQGKKQVGNKASGTVKIYNFTKLPLNLKAATTVLVLGNKTYNLTDDVLGLKPTTYSNPKTKEIDPNSLGASVNIVAVGGGEDYNVPAGTRMEITNQVFGSKPQFLYAKTDTEVLGGTTRYLSVISQDDITAAQAQLQDQALTQIRAKLSAQGLTMADKAYSIGSPQFTTDNPVGSETPSFQGTLQAKISGLAFKSDDLNNLIYQRLDQSLSSDKTLETDKPDQITYVVKSWDPNTMLGVLSVHFQGQAIFNVNIPNIAPELSGKTQSQVNEILRSKPGIQRVDITLAPIWQKNFPFLPSKIKVSVGSSDQPVN